jgi:hypothetical protein
MRIHPWGSSAMISRKGAFVGGVIVTLVLGSGSAYAATGGTFKLGGKNTAKKVTSLANTKGSALKLSSKSGTAPLVVSSSVRVAHLNSDLLDGLSSEQFLRTTGKAADAESVDGVDSSALALAAGATSYVVANGVFTDVTGDGLADALIATATCPAGTKLTGGGVDNVASGSTLINSPNTGGRWQGASLSDPSVDVTSDLQAYAVCYNPRGGAAPGSVATLSAARSAPHATSASEVGTDTVTRIGRAVAKRR